MDIYHFSQFPPVLLYTRKFIHNTELPMLMAWKLFVLMKADVKIDCVLKLYCNVFLHLLLIPAKQTKSKDTAPATWKFCQEQINISSDTRMAYCPTMAAFYTKKHRRYFKLLCWQVEHFHPKLHQFKQMSFYLLVLWLQYFTFRHIFEVIMITLMG